MFDLLATERVTSIEEIKVAYKGLITIGVFVIACIAAAIWWLRR